MTTPDEGPVAKIIDFGVAKATNQRLTEKTIYTEIGRAVGTPAYMSPEQAFADPALDGRSDVYNLGVVPGRQARRHAGRRPAMVKGGATRLRTSPGVTVARQAVDEAAAPEAAPTGY